MPRRKEPRIPDAVLDQPAAGERRTRKTVFDPNGLLDDLKKALACSTRAAWRIAAPDAGIGLRVGPRLCKDEVAVAALEDQNSSSVFLQVEDGAAGAACLGADFAPALVGGDPEAFQLVDVMLSNPLERFCSNHVGLKTARCQRLD